MSSSPASGLMVFISAMKSEVLDRRLFPETVNGVAADGSEESSVGSAPAIWSGAEASGSDDAVGPANPSIAILGIAGRVLLAASSDA